jgi:UrcA family protein
MTRPIYGACALLGTAMLPSGGSAADYRWLHGGREEVVSAGVAHADLDLSKPEHVKLLRQRVHDAAVRLCAEDGGEPLKIVVDVRRCVRAAKRAALPQIAAAKRKEAAQLAAHSHR